MPAIPGIAIPGWLAERDVSVPNLQTNSVDNQQKSKLEGGGIP